MTPVAHPRLLCPVCRLMAASLDWSNQKMPSFLKRQSEWVQGQYRTYMSQGVPKHVMRISIDAEGTMYFIIRDQKVSMYVIEY